MIQKIEITAADGHELDAYLAHPENEPRGGVVVIQEIFGVTAHIRNVAEQYAAQGFLAIAPALFDRVERNVEVPYTNGPAGMEIVKQLKVENTMRDIGAALEAAASAGKLGQAAASASKLGVVGYCWGGTQAYLCACRLKIAAAVSYYGGSTTQYLNEHPKCPVLYHFGERDTHIPKEAIDKIKAADPKGEFHMYPAEHGFNCTDRASYEPASAALAFKRSTDFFHRLLG